MREVVLQGVLATTSIWEIWLVYQIVYITILEKEYLGKKEKIIIWGNIIVLGSLLAVNRSVAFFSYVMLIFSIIVTSLCVWSIKRKAWFSIIGVVFEKYYLCSFQSNNLVYDSYVKDEESRYWQRNTRVQMDFVGNEFFALYAHEKLSDCDGTNGKR